MERSDRPHRLELRTHYKFAPNLAAEPPHLITWEIESDGAGSHVTLAWDAGPQVSRMLEGRAPKKVVVVPNRIVNLVA